MILNDFVLFFCDLLLHSLKSFKLLLIKPLSCKCALMDTHIYILLTCGTLATGARIPGHIFLCVITLHSCLLLLLLILSFEE